MVTVCCISYNLYLSSNLTDLIPSLSLSLRDSDSCIRASVKSLFKFPTKS